MIERRAARDRPGSDPHRLGGLAISAGYGWSSTGWVGLALAVGGLLVWMLSLLDARLRQVTATVR